MSRKSSPSCHANAAA